MLKKDVFFDDFANDLTPAHKDLLWTFISTGDRIISPASKQFMAQRANAHITTYQGGSHLTLVSHPEAVTATIAAAVAAVT